MPASASFFGETAGSADAEVFQILWERPGLRLERITSHGHPTPAGEWYDQDGDEWVLLARGSAVLEYADGERQVLRAGDYLDLPAHCRHRVAEVSEDAVWLALHEVRS